MASLLLDGKHEAIHNGLGLAWGFAFLLLGCFSFEGESVSELVLEEVPRLFCCITFCDTSQWPDAQAGGHAPPHPHQPAPSRSVYHKAPWQRLPDTPRNTRVPQAPRFCRKKSVSLCLLQYFFKKLNIMNKMEDPRTLLASFLCHRKMKIDIQNSHVFILPRKYVYTNVFTLQIQMISHSQLS